MLSVNATRFHWTNVFSVTLVSALKMNAETESGILIGPGSVAFSHLLFMDDLIPCIRAYLENSRANGTSVVPFF